MSTIIEKYYQGIYQQVHGEVNNINALFEHQGVKGSGNEAALRELIKKFIPKQYSVGTGIIVDQNGHSSRQSDIVIYDGLQYPSLLSLGSVHLFPVDIVYATIEVKTTLTRKEADDALIKIGSVKSLDTVNLPWTQADPLAIFAPVGFVFAFNSEARHFATFKNWFQPPDWERARLYPNLVGCLDQGILLRRERNVDISEIIEGRVFQRVKDASEDEPRKIIKMPDGNTSEWHDVEVSIDRSKTLLQFVLYLNDFLSRRKIHTNLSFLEHYLPFTTKLYMTQ